MRLAARKYKITDMLTLSFCFAPLYSSIKIALRLASALIPTLSIFVTAFFINTALGILDGRIEYNAVFKPLAYILAITAFSILSNTANSFLDWQTMILLRKKLRPLMTERTARLEYKHIEDAKTQDLISRVAPVFDQQVHEMFMRITSLLESFVFALGILVSVFTQVWWVAFCLLTASVPLMIIAAKAGKKSYDANREMTKIDRKVNYISDVIRSREGADERALFGYTDELNKNYGEQFHYARKFRLKVDLSNFIKQKSGGVIGSVVAIIAMLAMLGPVSSGAMNYGIFIGLITGVFSLSGRLSWGINWEIEDISRKTEYLKDLGEFLALSETQDALSLPAEKISFTKIEFKNVSFTYPGTEKQILKNISFIIENGRHYSFAGINGAGKTTITKLLTGLYDNYEGSIFLDDRELRTLSQPELKALSSVVYQDFARYFLTLYENIAVALPHERKDKRSRVEEAVSLMELTEAAGKLKDGLDTQLGKVHKEGVDLSGGQWQRAAMARCVVSEAPLHILDEPTAALDPVAESQVYHKFERISQGRTTIFISHRLGSTKLADTIFVLDEGTVAESGSHAELMARNGIYARMYSSQAGWYSKAGDAHV